MKEVVHDGYVWANGVPSPRVCITQGNEVLTDDSDWVVVHTDTETVKIPKARVIAIIEPREQP